MKIHIHLYTQIINLVVVAFKHFSLCFYVFSYLRNYRLLTQFYIHCRKVQYAQLYSYINLNQITFSFHNLKKFSERGMNFIFIWKFFNQFTNIFCCKKKKNPKLQPFQNLAVDICSNFKKCDLQDLFFPRLRLRFLKRNRSSEF